ncbi:MAG: DUF1542 domain-containing protein, partial [Elusimicrobia bacterium]|nr:DUF1542 domain-containing protein [Elusimicrobiota bacterium]
RRLGNEVGAAKTAAKTAIRTAVNTGKTDLDNLVAAETPEVQAAVEVTTALRDQKAALEALVRSANTAIDAATTVAEVNTEKTNQLATINTAVADAKTAVGNAIAEAKRRIGDELGAAKTAAKAAVRAAVDTGKTELDDLVTAESAEVQGAVEVTTALSNQKTALENLVIPANTAIDAAGTLAAVDTEKRNRLTAIILARADANTAVSDAIAEAKKKVIDEKGIKQRIIDLKAVKAGPIMGVLEEFAKPDDPEKVKKVLEIMGRELNNKFGLPELQKAAAIREFIKFFASVCDPDYYGNEISNIQDAITRELNLTEDQFAQIQGGIERAIQSGNVPRLNTGPEPRLITQRTLERFGEKAPLAAGVYESGIVLRAIFSKKYLEEKFLPMHPQYPGGREQQQLRRGVKFCLKSGVLFAVIFAFMPIFPFIAGIVVFNAVTILMQVLTVMLDIASSIAGFVIGTIIGHYIWNGIADKFKLPKMITREEKEKAFLQKVANTYRTETGGDPALVTPEIIKKFNINSIKGMGGLDYSACEELLTDPATNGPTEDRIDEAFIAFGGTERKLPHLVFQVLIEQWIKDQAEPEQKQILGMVGNMFNNAVGREEDQKNIVEGFIKGAGYAELNNDEIEQLIKLLGAGYEAFINEVLKVIKPAVVVSEKVYLATFREQLEAGSNFADAFSAAVAKIVAHGLELDQKKLEILIEAVKYGARIPDDAAREDFLGAVKRMLKTQVSKEDFNDSLLTLLHEAWNEPNMNIQNRILDFVISKEIATVTDVSHTIIRDALRVAESSGKRAFYESAIEKLKALAKEPGLLNPQLILGIIKDLTGPEAAPMLEGRYPNVLEQFLTYKKKITLINPAGKTLNCSVKAIYNKYYLEIGNRVIEIDNAEDARRLDPTGIFNAVSGTEILLGNPKLRKFLGIDKVSQDIILKGLPAGWHISEELTEVDSLFGTDYEQEDIDSAITYLENYKTDTLTNLAKTGGLTAEILIDFLDALTVISHKKSKNESVYDEYVEQLKQLIALSDSEKVVALGIISIDENVKRILAKAKELYGYLEKRKTGYWGILSEFFGTLKGLIKLKADNKITVVRDNGTTSNSVIGNVSELGEMRTEEQLVKALYQDLFNEAPNSSWDTNTVFEKLKSKAGALPEDSPVRKFVEESLKYKGDIQGAGEGARIKQGLSGGNKLFADTVPIKKDKIDELKAFYKKNICGNDEAKFRKVEPLLYYIDEDGELYTPIVLLIFAKSPESGMILGPSVFKYADIFKTFLNDADIARFDRFGVLRPDEKGRPGHGGGILAIIFYLAMMIEKTKLGNEIFNHQGDDTWDPGNLDALLGNADVKLGKAVMSVRTIAQRVTFSYQHDNFAAFQSEVKGKTLKKFSLGASNKLVVEDLTITGAEEQADKKDVKVSFKDSKGNAGSDKLSNLLQANYETAKKIAELAAEKQGDAQRGLWIKALEVFRDGVSGFLNKHKIFSVKKNEGGMLLVVDGQLVFIEKSQLQKEIEIKGKDEAGALVSGKFSVDDFLCIIAQNFNTNTFCLQRMAALANRSQKAKVLYHEYLKEVQGKSAEEALALEQEYREKISEITNSISPEEWISRTLALVLLMYIVYSQPTESKQGFTKLNMMAQNVAYFEAMLALTNVTAEDINIDQLIGIGEQLEKITDLDEREKQKNKLLKGLGLNLRTAAGLENVKRLSLIQVKKFSQYKDPDQINQVIEQLAGLYSDEKFVDTTKTELQIEAVNGIIQTKNKITSGLLSEKEGNVYIQILNKLVEGSTDKEYKELFEAGQKMMFREPEGRSALAIWDKLCEDAKLEELAETNLKEAAINMKNLALAASVISWTEVQERFIGKKLGEAAGTICEKVISQAPADVVKEIDLISKVFDLAYGDRKDDIDKRWFVTMYIWGDLCILGDIKDIDGLTSSYKTASTLADSVFKGLDNKESKDIVSAITLALNTAMGALPKGTNENAAMSAFMCSVFSAMNSFLVGKSQEIIKNVTSSIEKIIAGKEEVAVGTIVANFT